MFERWPTSRAHLSIRNAICASRKENCHPPYQVFSPSGEHALLISDGVWLWVDAEQLEQALLEGPGAPGTVVLSDERGSPEEMFGFDHSSFLGWKEAGGFSRYMRCCSSVDYLRYRLHDGRPVVEESWAMDDDAPAVEDRARGFEQRFHEQTQEIVSAPTEGAGAPYQAGCSALHHGADTATSYRAVNAADCPTARSSRSRCGSGRVACGRSTPPRYPRGWPAWSGSSEPRCSPSRT